MKLKNLVDHVSWEEVAKVLKTEYKEDWNKSFFGFENVFNRLKEMEPEEIEGEIVVGYAKDFIDGGEFIAVSHLINGEFFVPSFTPWNEWLGMQVSEDSLKRFSPAEIVGHSLWEMTFHGFSERKVEDAKNDLIKAIKSLK